MSNHKRGWCQLHYWPFLLCLLPFARNVTWAKKCCSRRVIPLENKFLKGRRGLLLEKTDSKGNPVRSQILLTASQLPTQAGWVEVEGTYCSLCLLCPIVNQNQGLYVMHVGGQKKHILQISGYLILILLPAPSIYRIYQNPTNGICMARNCRKKVAAPFGGWERCCFF